MALNEDCKNRLYNWKFRSAFNDLNSDATSYERDSVQALNDCFGNCGWFEGNIGELVGSVVALLIQLKVLDCGCDEGSGCNHHEDGEEINA